jgi:hypothetical protein
MIYLILTILNVIMSLTAIVSLVRLVTMYILAPRPLESAYLDIMVMIMLLMWQVFTLTIRPIPADMWPYKLVGVIWCVSTLYRAWAARFTSIKKDNTNKFYQKR